MIDMIYLAALDEVNPSAIEKKVDIQQSGKIHSKVAGRFEQATESITEPIEIFGKIRLAYLTSAHKISSTSSKIEKEATAIGGEIGLNTAKYYGINLHLSAYISQGVSFLNPSKDKLNEDFFDVNNDSFIYLAEASLDYSNDFFQTKLGRIKVETPYANSDDIRMAPNTFEGAWANIDYTSELSTQLLYLNRWAGYDSQNEDAGKSQNHFKDLVDEDSSGMFGASLTYKFAQNSELSVWYNYIDDMAAITYAELVGIYFIDGENIHIDYGLQASNIKELDNSNVDGDVFGAMGIMHYNGLFIGGAYDVSYSDVGKSVTNGFGGGPYYTSLDEATISAISEGMSEYQNANPNEKFSNNNAEAFRLGVGYEFNDRLLEGLVLEFVYGELSNDNGRIEEKDLILSYDFTDKLNLEAIYTNYKSTCDNNTFDRTLLRLDYSF